MLDTSRGIRPRLRRRRLRLRMATASCVQSHRLGAYRTTRNLRDGASTTADGSA